LHNFLGYGDHDLIFFSEATSELVFICRQKQVGYQYSSKYIFMFHKRKKVIQDWNVMRVGKCK